MIPSHDRACHIAGAEWIHLDVCDGGSMAPGAVTIGAGTVAAIRDAGMFCIISQSSTVHFNSFSLFVHIIIVPSMFLDVHVTSDNPMQVINAVMDALKDDMGSPSLARITFQYESLKTAEEVLKTATTIRHAGE